MGPGLNAERWFVREGWQRAWHGTKLAALYSIAYFGRLLESKAAIRGERFLQGAPGVYLHKDATARKSDAYTRLVQFDDTSPCFAVKSEVRTHRDFKVSVHRSTDQWRAAP